VGHGTHPDEPRLRIVAWLDRAEAPASRGRRTRALGERLKQEDHQHLTSTLSPIEAERRKPAILDRAFEPEDVLHALEMSIFAVERMLHELCEADEIGGKTNRHRGEVS